MRKPILYIGDILDWADAFYERVGRWPMQKDRSRVVGQTGLTWRTVDKALRNGNRGLRPGSSLAKLLLEQRGRRHQKMQPHFSIEKILAWADAHHRRTGEWPKRDDGKIADATNTWLAVDHALRKGNRGQPGGSSLALLLFHHRGVRSHYARPCLTAEQILAWADAHRARTGSWPTRKSGPVLGAPEENWRMIEVALLYCRRGLRVAESLAQLLARCRGARNRKRLPKLSLQDIRSWAAAHYRRNGRWPTDRSGPILEAPGETWMAVDMALRKGQRGFDPGESLPILLRKMRPPHRKNITGEAGPGIIPRD